MMQSKEPPTVNQITKTDASLSLPIVANNIGDDLRCSRRLMARALANGDTASSLAFAVSTSKLLGIAMKKQLRTSDLLLRAAAERVVIEMVQIINDHHKHTEGWDAIVDQLNASNNIEDN